MFLRLLIAVAGILCLLVDSSKENEIQDSFNEELFMKNLPDGKVYAHFQFTTKWNISLDSKDKFQHFRVFPKALGEVLNRFSVRELHLSMTQGLWRHEKWGYPVVDAPPGAELWVWFLGKGALEINSTWTDLTHVLSGMFCASINFMDMKQAVTPKLSFRPQGVTDAKYAGQYFGHVRYATLPRESVCTENLTPWKKLLPCGSRVGLSSLFNAIRLYDTSYHSLGIHFRPICLDADCTNTGVELSQTLSLVFDPVVLPTSSANKWDWTFKKLFGRIITSSCALADSSNVYVDLGTTNTTNFKLNPAPSRIDETTRGDVAVKYAVYNVAEIVSTTRVFNLDVKYNERFESGPIQPPVITANQFQTGSGQATGGVMCLLFNNHETADIVVLYQAVIPWFIRTYLHTLKIESFNSSAVGVAGTTIKPLHLHFVPGKDRVRPYHLELVVNLPAHSVVRLSYQFEKQLLRWLEYPPDANHGFYVGSVVVSTVLPDARNYTGPARNESLLSSIFSSESDKAGTGMGRGYFVRLHTESLLVALPTPDFSMPYNVICLACTVIAIVFGSVHNLTTRRFVVFDATKHRGLRAKITDTLALIRSQIFKRKVVDVKDDSNDNSKDNSKVHDTSEDKGASKDKGASVSEASANDGRTEAEKKQKSVVK